jgi:phage baseplate assembly protein W|tara:strand:- start:1232 stop:1636 length:405 start_codon:yes stop_codon:yes gene_type:complete
MSARQNDLNSNTYVGMSFPLNGDTFNDFALTKTTIEQSVHNLRNLLLTVVGERVGQPEFGSQLKAICFEQIDDELPIKIENEVRRAVSKWLSHIEIKSVETLTQDGDKSNVFVKIKFIPALSSEELETVLNPTG